jgi:hypothetical protein
MRIKFAVLVLIVLLTGCALPGSRTPTSIPSALPSPTETTVASSPTPDTPLVILIIPSDMPAEQSDLYQTTINDLAKASGMRFQVRNNLSSTEVASESGLKIVVAFPPDPGVVELASSAPQVQFLGVTIPGLVTSSNLSSLGGDGVPVVQQAFLAGYIATLLSPDYRVGIIYPKDTPEGNLAYTTFLNGMTFYCGLCNPQFPPWYKYPVHSEIPSDTPEGQYPSYSKTLKDYMVDYAYVFPSVATSDLLDTMAGFGLNIIGQTRTSDSLASNWVVSIQPELIPAIQAIWPDLVAGKGGQNISMPLFLVDVNPDLLSEGKLNDVQQILDRLQRGEISTGATP